MMTIKELKAENCKECSLFAKGECNENCLRFARLKILEHVEQYPEINRKNLLNYLRSLVRFNETDFDLGYNEAVHKIIDKIEAPEDEYVFCNECEEHYTCSDAGRRDGCEFGRRSFDNVTNGDIIKATFPDCRVVGNHNKYEINNGINETESYIIVRFDHTEVEFNAAWWGSLYKGEN